jgi:hypothetical protein
VSVARAKSRLTSPQPLDQCFCFTAPAQILPLPPPAPPLPLASRRPSWPERRRRGRRPMRQQCLPQPLHLLLQRPRLQAACWARPAAAAAAAAAAATAHLGNQTGGSWSWPWGRVPAAGACMEEACRACFSQAWSCTYTCRCPPVTPSGRASHGPCSRRHARHPAYAPLSTMPPPNAPSHQTAPTSRTPGPPPPRWQRRPAHAACARDRRSLRAHPQAAPAAGPIAAALSGPNRRMCCCCRHAVLTVELVRPTRLLLEWCCAAPGPDRPQDPTRPSQHDPSSQRCWLQHSSERSAGGPSPPLCAKVGTKQGCLPMPAPASAQGRQQGRAAS